MFVLFFLLFQKNTHIRRVKTANTHTHAHPKVEEPDAAKYLEHVLDDFLAKARISDDGSSSGSDSSGDDNGEGGSDEEEGGGGGLLRRRQGLFAASRAVPEEGEGGEGEEEEDVVAGLVAGGAGGQDDEVEEFLTRHEYLGVRALGALVSVRVCFVYYIHSHKRQSTCPYIHTHTYTQNPPRSPPLLRPPPPHPPTHSTQDKAAGGPQWDCETIVSTFSTLDNHPAVIAEEPSSRRRGRGAGRQELQGTVAAFTQIKPFDKTPIDGNHHVHTYLQCCPLRWVGARRGRWPWWACPARAACPWASFPRGRGAARGGRGRRRMMMMRRVRAR